MSITRPLTRTAAVAATSLVAAAAPGAILAGPASAKTYRKSAVTQAHHWKHTANDHRFKRIRMKPHS